MADPEVGTERIGLKGVSFEGMGPQEAGRIFRENLVHKIIY